MANTYFASTKDIEFKGAWKTNDSEEIIELGPPVTYWTFLTIAKDQDEGPSSELDSEAYCLDETNEDKAIPEENYEYRPEK